jgi:transposase
MASAYSNDLRVRVLKAIDEGNKIKLVSERFNVCIKTIYNWRRLKASTGSYEAKTGYQNGHSHKIKDLEAFKGYVEKNPNKILEEMADSLGNMSTTTVHRALKKIGFTRKKNQLRVPGKERRGKDCLPRSNS